MVEGPAEASPLIDEAVEVSRRLFAGFHLTAPEG
jgi:hypothetical protein